MKRVILVIETPGTIRIIGYDYDKAEPLDHIIDLKRSPDPLGDLEEIVYRLENRGFDTRILKRFIKRKKKHGLWGRL